MHRLFSIAAGRARLALTLVALSLAAGCASLPTFVPDMSRRAPSTVQLVGARGPLTAAQSKAVLDRLRADNSQSDIFDRHLALEQEIAGTPLVAGNQVRLLKDGPATYDAMLAAIGAAKDHVNMETYILESDEVGQRFADALLAKQRQGVQVNLIYDSVGTIGTKSEFFERLGAGGVRLLEFNPINPLNARRDWQFNNRDHRKLLVVDGEVAFLGGINISSVYSGNSSSRGSASRARAQAAPAGGAEPGKVPWRDTDLEIRGPVVADFQKLFLDTWAKQKNEKLDDRNYFPPPKSPGKLVVRAIGSAPDDPYSTIYVTLLSALTNAETSIQVTNAYFAPDPQLLSALTDAARRGVDVQMILPSQTDSWLVFHAGRNYYEPLLRAGVKIYERRGAILHSKTALVDGVWSTVGSTNLDWRSFLHNQEVNAVILGADFGAQVREMFERDLAQSDRISLEQWQRRGLDARMKELLARAWEYWL